MVDKISKMALEIDRIELLNEARRRKLSGFICFTMPTYQPEWFHLATCKKIEEWAKGKGKKKLMIFMPPQHGKSQISTRHTPAWLLGRNPNEKIAIAAYNGVVASKFNRDVQRIMLSSEFKQVFSDVLLPEVGISQKSERYVRNNREFDIVDHAGSLVSVGVGGGLTSRQVDTMIIDDVYKDAKEAWSPITRQNVEEWYATVIQTRLHNDSKVLIVFTRWHDQDLAGYLLKEEPDQWEVVKFPALKTEQPNEVDPREIDEALWPHRHSRERLEKIRKQNPLVFENLYQQNPAPKAGTLYEDFEVYDLDELKATLENRPHSIRAYVDVADTGTDYLCAIAYAMVDDQAFVLDVIYTQDPTSKTELRLANFLIENTVTKVYIEGNAGGSIYARNVKRIYAIQGGRICGFEVFTQRQNKEARIISSAGTVSANIIMPANWAKAHPVFFSHVNRFDKVFRKNAHDDAPDALTGIVDKEMKGQGKYLIGY